MKKEYIKPTLGNANHIRFENAYACEHSGAKTGGCQICVPGFGDGFNFGDVTGFGSFDWSAWWAYIIALWNSLFKKK